MILKNVRVNWLNVLKPHKNLSGDDIFDLQIIIDKNDTKNLETIKAAMESVLEDAKEKNGAKAIAGVKFQMKDGDSETDNAKGAEYLKGCYFFTAKNKKQPTCLKAVRVGNKIEKKEATEADFYSGMYAVLEVSPYFYNTPAKRGITNYINTVIKTRDGERLGKARAEIEIDFDDVGLAEEDDWAVL